MSVLRFNDEASMMTTSIVGKDFTVQRTGTKESEIDSEIVICLIDPPNFEEGQLLFPYNTIQSIPVFVFPQPSHYGLGTTRHPKG